MWDEIILEMPKFIPAYSESELKQRIEETVQWCAGCVCAHCRENRKPRILTAEGNYYHQKPGRLINCHATEIWQAWDEKNK